MRLNLRTVLAAAIAAVAFVTAAHADQLDDIKKKGVIVFGVLGTDEPNSFVDPKTREIVGYEVDIAKAIAQKIGVKAEFKQLAVAARIPELQQGRVDVLAASLTHNKERESQIDFSLTTFVTGQKVLVKTSSGISDIGQLAGKKVLTVKAAQGHREGGAAQRRRGDLQDHPAGLPGAATGQGRGLRRRRGLAGQRPRQAGAGQEGLCDPHQHQRRAARSRHPQEQGRRSNVIDGTLRGLESSGEAEKLFFKWYGPTTKLQFDKRSFKIDSDKI